MKPSSLAPGRAIATALVIWFVHFMLCWAVAEFRAEDVPATRLAWAFTVAALLAIAVHGARLRRLGRHGDDDLPTLRIARGANAIAAVAVLFTALPTIVWRA